MRPSPRTAALASALTLWLAPAPVEARPVAGVEVPESASPGGRPLVLNGAGLRTRLVFRVYVAALYLPARSRDAAAILAADGPWQVTLSFLRNVGHHQVLDAFSKAFERNSPGQLENLRAGLERFDAVMTDLGAGQALVLHYLPGDGTTLTVPGGGRATVGGREFGEAVLRTWLGEHPADPALARALLGG